MLFETLFQYTSFLWLFFGGLCSGIFFDISTLFLKIFKKNAFFANFFDFFSTLLTLFLFFIINLKINFGQIRLFSVFSFFLSFAIERFVSKKFIAFYISKWYNNFNENRRKNKQKEKQL